MQKAIKKYKIELFANHKLSTITITKILKVINQNFPVFKFCGRIIYIETYRTKDELNKFFQFVLGSQNLVKSLCFVVKENNNNDDE